jgi:hypothetical protein
MLSTNKDQPRPDGQDAVRLAFLFGNFVVNCSRLIWEIIRGR